MRDPILVVGGGIGGLTAALALGRHGYRVRVLEETPEFGAIGYGIQLGPNVFHMFDRLGLSEAILHQSIVPRALVMLDALDGEEVACIPTGDSFRRRFKQPYVVLHRVDLHGVLLDACKAVPGIELMPSTAAASFKDLGEGVRVVTKDGRALEGAAVIGADGLGSAIRAQMCDEGAPRFIGYVAHRTIVPMERVPMGVRREDVVLWGGPGFHIVHYPLRRRTVFNIVAVFRTSTYAEKGDAQGHRAEIENTYRDAHPVMKALLAMMDLERRWAISDRDPIRHWHQGRVVLLGDAAHPTLQSLAQGACMAIEDAVCLADLIHAADGDFTAAFRRYESARLLRTARVQLESRALWPFYHAEGITRDVRNQTTAAWNEDHMFGCLAWLYDGFRLPSGREQAAHRSRVSGNS
jgi:2-polyprenyl-6-methoxyphenol hydroxylase-like FAD-dependent oxidoreductase